MSLNNNHHNVIPKKLNIVHINVNSLIKLDRRLELDNFLKTNNPDIVLLSETKLNIKHKLAFKDYHIVRKDRRNSKCGGGTAILVKKEIKYEIHNNTVINAFKCLETCIIKIPTNSRDIIYIIAAYYPSGNNDTYFKNEVHKLFESLNLDSLENYYILAGDLNSKHTDWGNVVVNHKGTLLKTWLEENNIKFKCKLYASDYPSFPRSGSYIDICLADHRIYIEGQNSSTNCLNTLTYDSDHNAIQILAYKNYGKEPFLFVKHQGKAKLNFRKTNWRSFQNKIINSLHSYNDIPDNLNLSNNDIDLHLERLNAIILSAIEQTVPKFQDKDQLHKFTSCVIKKLQKEKNKLLSTIKQHNRLQTFLTDRDLMIQKCKLKLIRKLIEENLVLAVNDHHKRKYSNLNPKDPLKMFSEARKQYRNNDSQEIETIRLPLSGASLLQKVDIDTRMLEIDNTANKYIIRDKVHILDTVGVYLESIYADKDIDMENTVHREVKDSFTRFLEEKSTFDNNPTHDINNIDSDRENIMNSDYLITDNEITYIFKSLKGKLSSGIDNIPNIVLKKAPDKLILEYRKLFNNMLNNSYFPQNWKLGKVVTIPKKGKDSSEPANLRAITLLPNISKIFEVCINTRIIKILESQSIVNENQFGFKYKHSTIHAAHTLVSNIHWNLHRNLYTGACLIDFQKAFDNAWIPGLFCKLRKYKFPLNFMVLLYSMLSDRYFVVSNLNYTSSRKFCIVNGLQQGTVNAPILFNIYIHEMLNNIPNSIGFADDITVYHADDNIENINKNLQEKFDAVIKYSINWNMKINYDKCESILFRPPVGKCNYNIRRYWKSFGIKSPNDGQNVPNRDVVKYLGIQLDKFLYFNYHVNTQIPKARRAFFKHKTLFYSKHIASNTKILFYKALVRPILTYGCPIWFNISPSYMEKIRKFERKCLRVCTSLHRSADSNFVKYVSNIKLYNSANIMRIDNFIIKLIRRHIAKSTQDCSNNMIKAPYYTNYDYIQRSLTTGYVPPEAFIYLDQNEFIQNRRGIPIFYHLYRRANVKAVNCDLLTNNDIRFDTSVSNKDFLERRKINRNIYWWITS